MIVNKMQKTLTLPKMIFFDYGETLIHEEKFNGVNGYAKLLEFAIENRSNATAEVLAEEMQKINEELGRFSPEKRDIYLHEITDKALINYLLEKFGIRLSKSYEEVCNLFWDASAEASPTGGIEELLACIRQHGIGTGVISNISYSEEALRRRIEKLIPSHSFDMVISSSDIVFRKPSERIFELALLKGNVTADEVWHCGDQYSCDIVGALRTGIQPIWYHQIDENQEYDSRVICLDTWSDLQELLNQYGGHR